MSYPIMHIWRMATVKQRIFVAVAVFVVAFIFSGSFGAWLSHRKDAVFNRREAERMEEINRIVRDAEALRVEKRELEARAAELKLMVDAQDQIIAGATERVKANDRKLDSIFAEFEHEKSNLDTLDAGAIHNELIKRLRAAGIEVKEQ